MSLAIVSFTISRTGALAAVEGVANAEVHTFTVGELVMES